jgi:hypothetical protein
VTWADWDEELLSLELQELNESDFDLSLTGFDPGEIDGLLAIPDEERANAAPPLPENPVSRVGDLWLYGKNRVLCGDALRPEDVARLLGERKLILMVTDPPYGIELDSEWRDRAGLNGCGPAEASYMKRRTQGHTETTISGDTRADWSEAFELVPSLQAGTKPSSGLPLARLTREVLDGLLRIGFQHHQQSSGTRREQSSRAHSIGFSMSPAGLCGRRTRRGSGRSARTPRFGRRRPRNSSWAARVKKSMITRPRSRWT